MTATTDPDRSAATERYLRRRFRVAPDLLEVVSAELWVGSPLGLHLVEEGIDVYYADGSEPRAALAGEGVELVAEERLEAADWLASWRSSAAPFALGDRFWIDPGEEPGGPPPAGRIALRLPARRAFGTGSHASTRLAMAWLEEVPIAGARVLDLGAGSGILAFASATLGARHVVALERDLEAVLLAGANTRINGIAVGLIGGTTAALGGAVFDLVAANLLSSHLLPELDSIAARLASGGTLVYSGALGAERRDLLPRFERAGLRVRGEKSEGEWSAFRLERSATP